MPKVQPSKYASSSRAVVRRGTARWLFGHCEELYLSLLNLDIKTGHVSLEKLPFQSRYYISYEPYLTLALNGALSLLWMQTRGRNLEIWEQHGEQPNQEDGAPEWVCTRTLKFRKVAKVSENEERGLRVLGHKCGTLLFSDDTILGVYTADLKTGMLEEVLDWPCNNYIIPRENRALGSGLAQNLLFST